MLSFSQYSNSDAEIPTKPFLLIMTKLPPTANSFDFSFCVGRTSGTTDVANLSHHSTWLPFRLIYLGIFKELLHLVLCSLLHLFCPFPLSLLFSSDQLLVPLRLILPAVELGCFRGRDVCESVGGQTISCFLVPTQKSDFQYTAMHGDTKG